MIFEGRKQQDCSWMKSTFNFQLGGNNYGISWIRHAEPFTNMTGSSGRISSSISSSSSSSMIFAIVSNTKLDLPIHTTYSVPSLIKQVTYVPQQFMKGHCKALWVATRLLYFKIETYSHIHIILTVTYWEVTLCQLVNSYWHFEKL